MPVVYNQAALADAGHLTEYIAPDGFRYVKHESDADNGINGLGFKRKILSVASDHALHQPGLAKSLLRHFHHLSGEIGAGEGDPITQEEREHPPGATGYVDNTPHFPSKVTCCDNGLLHRI